MENRNLQESKVGIRSTDLIVACAKDQSTLEEVWVSRFKNRISYARVKFELEVASCRAHVRGHLSQLLGINSSPLSI